MKAESSATSIAVWGNYFSLSKYGDWAAVYAGENIDIQ